MEFKAGGGQVYSPPAGSPPVVAGGCSAVESTSESRGWLRSIERCQSLPDCGSEECNRVAETNACGFRQLREFAPSIYAECEMHSEKWRNLLIRSEDYIAWLDYLFCRMILVIESSPTRRNSPRSESSACEEAATMAAAACVYQG
jgi:hypothetical protein